MTKAMEMKPEQMGAFFDRRPGGYEQHQLSCIESAAEFYPLSAALLPTAPDSAVLDLGCGTGPKPDAYFRQNPDAAVTGIDPADGMLAVLRKKHPNRRLTLIHGSYFDVPFPQGAFDAAISVESLHHFTMEQKIALYQKLLPALKQNGYLILTDYVADNEQAEAEGFVKLAELKRAQGIVDNGLYHFDTPLTIEHETEALLRGGFAKITLVRRWAATCLLKSEK